MKTYIYTYRRGGHDKNGNPRHWVTVYRVKHNVPTQLGGLEGVHYLTPRMAVENVIARVERWGRRIQAHSERSNLVRMARMRGLIQIIQI